MKVKIGSEFSTFLYIAYSEVGRGQRTRKMEVLLYLPSFPTYKYYIQILDGEIIVRDKLCCVLYIVHCYVVVGKTRQFFNI